MELFIKINKEELSIISNALLSHRENVVRELAKIEGVYSETNTRMLIYRKELRIIEQLQKELGVEE